MAKSESKLAVKTGKAATPAERDWSPLVSLRHEIDRLFEDLQPFGWHFPRRGSALGFTAGSNGWPANPAFDVVEKDKEYEVTAELPGMEEKDIEVKLQDQLLTIRGEKSESREEEKKNYHLSERRYGSFQRSFQIPQGVDIDKIEASFTKGVLSIRLPKSVEAQKAEKKISIKSA